MRKQRNKKRHKIKIVLFFILGIIVIAGVLMLFTIKKIEFEGNSKYTEEEIRELIFTEKYDYHTLYFFFKTKFLEQPEIPFVDSYDIHLKSLTSVGITIYEKNIVGCIEYMGNYMYFDKEGIVVESLTTPISGIPIVTGLEYEYIIINERLPIDDKNVFDLLLDISQMLKKYNIPADKITLSPTMEIELTIDQVKVELGKKDNLKEKVADLKDIVELLVGKTGTFNMKNYNENKKEYTLITE